LGGWDSAVLKVLNLAAIWTKRPMARMGTFSRYVARMAYGHGLEAVVELGRERFVKLVSNIGCV